MYRDEPLVLLFRSQDFDIVLPQTSRDCSDQPHFSWYLTPTNCITKEARAMSTAVKILIGIIVCVLLLLGIAAFYGLFIWAIQIVVVVAIIAAILRYWLVGSKGETTADLQAKTDQQAHRNAEKELKKLERKAEAQRNKA